MTVDSRTIVGTLAATLLLPLALPPGGATTTVVYSNDFEASVGAGWVSSGGTPSRATTPAGCTRCTSFLGELVGQDVCLEVGGLPAHAIARVELDLYVLKSIDGNGHDYFPLSGPDVFSVASAGSLLHCNPNPCADYDSRQLGEIFLCRTLLPPVTFSNHQPQSFPCPYVPHYLPGHVDHAPRTGATEVDTLGYSYWGIGNSVYHFAFEYPHWDPEIALFLKGRPNQDVGDESWGIDNVVITVS